MSWRHDRELSEVLGNFQAAGNHAIEHRLIGWAKPMYGETTINNMCVFSVMHPSATLIQATGCTYEWEQVVDIFVHYTANASAITFSDMYYWGRVNAMTYCGEHSPPDLCCFFADTAVSFEAQGVVYYVTKNNLTVGGVAFPSAIARVGTR